jgi:hypothetical protein
MLRSNLVRYKGLCCICPNLEKEPEDYITTFEGINFPVDAPKVKWSDGSQTVGPWIHLEGKKNQVCLL